jgi:hypothetical protein
MSDQSRRQSHCSADRLVCVTLPYTTFLVEHAVACWFSPNVPLLNRCFAIHGISLFDLRGIEWAIFDAEGLTKPRIT